MIFLLNFMYRKSSFISIFHHFPWDRRTELLIKTILSPKISKPNAFACVFYTFVFVFYSSMMFFFFYFIQNTEFIRYHCIVCKNLTSILQFYFQWLADKTKYILKPTANVVFVMQALSIIWRYTNYQLPTTVLVSIGHTP